MQRQWFMSWIAVMGLGLVSPATATTIEAMSTPFTGDPTSVRVTLEEEGNGIRFDLSVEQGLGDLRGIFFDLANDALLAGLEAIGSVVSAFDSSGSVINMGQGNNLNGGGSPCPCDVGISLGTPGIGGDDLQTASFLLVHESQALTLTQFFGQDFGVRVTSVGDSDGREGSSKLRGNFPLQPIPEPSTATLVALGLAGLARAGRRRAAPALR